MSVRINAAIETSTGARVTGDASLDQRVERSESEKNYCCLPSATAESAETKFFILLPSPQWPGAV